MNGPSRWPGIEKLEIVILAITSPARPSNGMSSPEMLHVGKKVLCDQVRFFDDVVIEVAQVLMSFSPRDLQEIWGAWGPEQCKTTLLTRGRQLQGTRPASLWI